MTKTCHHCQRDKVPLGVESNDLCDYRCIGYAQGYHPTRGCVWPPKRRQAVQRHPELFGEDNPSAKFTAEQVATIRREWSEGATKDELALRYDVNESTIQRIYMNKTYKLHAED